MSDSKEYKTIMGNLDDNVHSIFDFCTKFGILDGRKLADFADLIKTLAQFRRALRRAILLFWRGDEDAFGFIDRMLIAIDTQFRKAWREGMRELGLDPAKDSLPEKDGVLEQAIMVEYDYILGLAEAVEKARTDKTPVDPLYSRVEMWVNRYNEIKNLAMITYGKEKKLEWVVGPTEHCSDCAALNGIVAFAREWQASRWRPQGRMLECGGFNCQCRLVPTNKPRSGVVL